VNENVQLKPAKGPNLEVKAHKYSHPGTYNAIVIIRDDFGAQKSVNVTVSVTDLPPIAKGTYQPGVVNITEKVRFDASASYDLEGPLTYNWQFGDGSSSTLEKPEHAYIKPGEYKVSLTVIDSMGQYDTIELTPVTVANRPPTAIFRTTGDIVEKIVTIFDASQSYDLETNITYHWTMGDGGVLTVGPIVQYTYQNPGNYTVILTVTDMHELTDSIQQQIQVISAKAQDSKIDDNDTTGDNNDNDKNKTANNKTVETDKTDNNDEKSDLVNRLTILVIILIIIVIILLLLLITRRGRSEDESGPPQSDPYRQPPPQQAQPPHEPTQAQTQKYSEPQLLIQGEAQAQSQAPADAPKALTQMGLDAEPTVDSGPGPLQETPPQIQEDENINSSDHEQTSSPMARPVELSGESTVNVVVDQSTNTD
jgi:PKD repeat protein